MRTQPKPTQRPFARCAVIGLVFLIAAFFLALFAYQQSKAFFVTYNVTELQGLALENTPTPAIDAQGQPIPTDDPALAEAGESAPPPAIEGPAAQPWDKA